jgi:hypothetical protein
MTSNLLGKLCVGGDWACANGDVEALGDVVSRLADLSQGPLHGQLVALAALCRHDPERAPRRWDQLRPRVVAQAR